MKKISLIVTLVLILSTILLGQSESSESQRAEAERQRRESVAIMNRSENARPTFSRGKSLYRRLTQDEEKRLQPAPEDFAKYAQFLKKSKTGLVKLISDPKCNDLLIDVNNEKCLQALPIFGWGSLYSFDKESHSALSKWDIHYSDNAFTVGVNWYSSGIIFDLGNVALDSINLETPEIRNLKGLPPRDLQKRLPIEKKEKNRLEKNRFAGKIEISGKSYPSQAPAQENMTYAVRSLLYRERRNPYIRGSYDSYPGLTFYDDSIIIFRVVSRDAEGNVTLLWKELHRKEGQRLK